MLPRILWNKKQKSAQHTQQLGLFRWRVAPSVLPRLGYGGRNTRWLERAKSRNIALSAMTQMDGRRVSRHRGALLAGAVLLLAGSDASSSYSSYSSCSSSSSSSTAFVSPPARLAAAAGMGRAESAAASAFGRTIAARRGDSDDDDDDDMDREGGSSFGAWRAGGRWGPRRRGRGRWLRHAGPRSSLTRGPVP